MHLNKALSSEYHTDFFQYTYQKFVEKAAHCKFYINKHFWE